MTPQELAATHHAAFGENDAWSASAFRSLIAQNGMILCGDVRSFVLGRVTVDEAEIITVATDPAYQRQGLGAATLTAFETSAKAQGATRVFLEVAADNDPAIALYNKQKYTPVGLRQNYYARTNGPNADAHVLEKKLC
ncbi:GNAT family N-acetyltransferase [Yoonia sp. 208BN28-4]|uniref:GNAT family N-acetyltransferase n=1 Tax=Yoonia sp. 208BN28-4 TaxID=3126505 RepID=UPI0030AE9511